MLAKNFNLESAEAMLRENLRWRKENKIDSIQSENWDDMIPDFPVSMDTYDKIGQPRKGQRHRRFCTSIVENITGQVFERQQKGMQIVQVVALLNADGFNVVQHACPVCIPGWIQFMQTIESYYPEWIDEFIIINAPATVQIVLNAIRPVLSRSTREAVKVFGPNKRKWMDYLDKKISKEERRPQYGGKKPAFKQ
ncbi:SEC14-like protein 2 [Orchesella cincta]|uniref:SEC14-like protein 2 n=1 Tax=Orchesella cincta TaxID=48709 RepID=A0A1D2MHL6_ORCCI|nr:SEC14-like protein 2 [Orchesella cincta]